MLNFGLWSSDAIWVRQTTVNRVGSGHSSHSGKHCGIISMHFPRQALVRTSFTILSLSPFLFAVAIWRIRFAEGQLANTAKLAKNATKTYLAGNCRRSRHRPQTAGAASASAGGAAAGSMLILMLMLILDMRLRLRCRLGIGMQCESCGPIKSGSQ